MKMSRRLQIGAFLVVLVLVGTGAFVMRRAHRRPTGPLEVSLWYWHVPFQLSKSERTQLDALGVRTLFVRTGTFRLDTATNTVRTSMPQIWKTGGQGIGIHLVFNFAPDLLHQFGKTDNGWLAQQVSREIGQAAVTAKQAGLQVAGVQLDFDCPTRLLEKYARLVREIRVAPAVKGLTFSVTALPTWLNSGGSGIVRLAEAIDFLAPQFYEGGIGRTVKEFQPISTVPTLARKLQAADRLGVPFYAGLPAYGHALVYDGTGKLLGAYHDMGVLDALRHPGLRTVQVAGVDPKGRPATRDTYIGEDRVELVPRDMHPDDPGAHEAPDHGMGARPYYLVYDCPTPLLLARNMDVLRADRPANCRGVILFRLPERGEAMTLPLVSIKAALNGATLQPHLQIKAEVASSPWEAIDTGSSAGRIAHTLTVTAMNDGTASTHLGPEAVEMRLRFDHPGIEEASPGGFDSVEGYFETPGRPPIRSSIPRANLLVYRALRLGAGERLKAGAIRLPPDGPGRCEGSWSAQGPGGFETVRGRIPATSLAGP